MSCAVDGGVKELSDGHGRRSCHVSAGAVDLDVVVGRQAG